MAENIKFNYLYRDAGNYKSWGTTIFTNPNGMSIYEIEDRLRKSFFLGELFIASQIGIPEVFLYTEGNATKDDLCFHEFESLELTNESPSDLHKRTIKDFVKQIEAESVVGWRSFDPQIKKNVLQIRRVTHEILFQSIGG